MRHFAGFRKRNGFAAFVCTAVLLLSGCEPDSATSDVPRDIPFRPDGLLELIDEDGSLITSVVIEIAKGDSARARGLMQRATLPSRGGMLFLDDSASVQTFWMKNTLLPLDIIFIGADSQVVSISKRVAPLSEERVSSTGPAKYVLEVKAGFADTYGIDENARARWRLVNSKETPATESE